MSEVSCLWMKWITLCGIFLSSSLVKCQYRVQHPVAFAQRSSEWQNPYTQQGNLQWNQYSTPRKRSPEYSQSYQNEPNYQPVSYRQNPFDAQQRYQNYPRYPQTYQSRSSVDLVNSETREVPNDPRLLSSAAFSKISETLGAINTVGHYLVDFVNENEGDKTDMKQLPQALYTISKNVLGRNVTDTIAPFVKRALPKVLPDTPVDKIATTNLNPENDAKSCTTPEGEEGICEDLSNCPQLLLNLVNLRESFCFRDLFVPGVCCPKDSIVPSTPSASKPISPETNKPTFLSPVTQKPQRPLTTKNPSAVLILTTKRPKPVTVPTTSRPIITSAIPSLTTPRPIIASTVITSPPAIFGNFSNVVDENDCGQREIEGGRIIGGNEAKSGEWPWMAAIFLQGSQRREFWCGGTLVGKRHVLTAAHCTRDNRQKPFPARQFIVRLGDVDLSRDDEPSRPVNLRVAAVRAHEDFSRAGYYNDIAVLVLAENVQKSKYVIPICLPRGEVARRNFEDSLATVVGWGTTRYGGSESSTLLEARLPVWANEECDRAYFQPINEGFLCAGYPRGGTDACQGDSGGPLMLSVGGRWTQIGVVSFGNKCGEPGYPGVYTRVTHYLNWLDQRLQ